MHGRFHDRSILRNWSHVWLPAFSWVVKALNAAIASHVFGVELWRVGSDDIDLLHTHGMFLLCNVFRLSPFHFFISCFVVWIYRVFVVIRCIEVLPEILSTFCVQNVLISFFVGLGTFVCGGDDFASWKVFNFFRAVQVFHALVLTWQTWTGYRMLLTCVFEPRLVSCHRNDLPSGHRIGVHRLNWRRRQSWQKVLWLIPLRLVFLQYTRRTFKRYICPVINICSIALWLIHFDLIWLFHLSFKICLMLTWWLFNRFNLAQTLNFWHSFLTLFLLDKSTFCFWTFFCWKDLNFVFLFYSWRNSIFQMI